VIGVRDVNQLEAVNFDRAGGQLDHFAVPGEVIGALAIHFDRRIARRHLRDRPGIGRKQRLDGLAGGPRGAGFGHRAVGVVAVALLAPAHGKAVGLAAVHDEGNGLGRLAERNRQAARGERVERAGMARALAGEQPLDRADGMGRGHADRLVEHDPAVHVALLAAELLRPLFCRTG